MATIEVLLNLGEGQGIDYKKLALAGLTTGGGQGALTWTDVHWAMTGLTPPQKAVLYVKYNPSRLNASDLASLTTHLWLSLENREARSRPRPMIEPTKAEKALMDAAQASRDRRQARTVETCLNEYIDTKLCDRCRPSGTKTPGKVGKSVPGVGVVYEACDKCQGRQWLPWSDNRRAQGCGGDRNLWKPRYERNYLALLDECSELHRRGAQTLKDRLFGPAALETKMQARA